MVGGGSNPGKALHAQTASPLSPATTETRGADENLGETLAKLEKVRAPSGQIPHRSAEIENTAAPATAVAVPAPLRVVIHVETGGVVVVQSVGPGAVYATEVKGRPKPRLPLLRTGYLGGTGNGD
jgi:hypothetical protein